jgi:molecular chaperone HscB
MICWSCQREAGPGALCAACSALQPPDDAQDLFSVLGVPARYSVDLPAAEAAYKELSRQVHPDRFATADPRARRASLARTVQLNLAWRTIKDPIRRAEYLLTRAGIDVDSGQKASHNDGKETHKIGAPPAFLLEILELNDELNAARMAGDSAKVAVMAAEMRDRANESMKAIGAALDSGMPGQLEEAGRLLVALRYYRRFIDEAGRHESRTDGGGGEEEEGEEEEGGAG